MNRNTNNHLLQSSASKLRPYDMHESTQYCAYNETENLSQLERLEKGLAKGIIDELEYADMKQRLIKLANTVDSAVNGADGKSGDGIIDRKEMNRIMRVQKYVDNSIDFYEKNNHNVDVSKGLNATTLASIEKNKNAQVDIKVRLDNFNERLQIKSISGCVNAAGADVTQSLENFSKIGDYFVKNNINLADPKLDDKIKQSIIQAGMGVLQARATQAFAKECKNATRLSDLSTQAKEQIEIARKEGTTIRNLRDAAQFFANGTQAAAFSVYTAARGLGIDPDDLKTDTNDI
jgi:hypothetical protein